MKFKSLIACIAIILFCSIVTVTEAFAPTDSLITVPLGGNAWRTDKDTLGGKITNDGISDWTSKAAAFTAYVRFNKTGKIKLWVSLKNASGQSRIGISLFNSEKEIIVNYTEAKDIYAGEWTVKDTGYTAIHLKAISKTGADYAEVNSIKLSGSAIDAKTAYVKNNEGNFFHWGRRGPSVHLNYILPENSKAEWFYNEVTVPVGNDVLGSYFMADGFGEGYFGMQVNSPAERHILFSVWSPFTTDDPKAIPDDQKIAMLKKGVNVHTGEFGNEGSGGQSYLLYNWKAGNTYKFLVHIKPDSDDHTTYTTWFFAPELGKWQLIASFSRPQTQARASHLHSFLENFEPDQGTHTRKVLFNNQWVADEAGKWTELTQARFTTDNTGNVGYRKDYAGGVIDGSFYLKNCGFFDNFTQGKIILNRKPTGKAPDVDLSKLP